MAVARLGYAAAGRFPRWGYLDKFYMNAVMPRAFLTTALIAGAITGAAIGWKEFQEWRRGKRAAQAGATRRPVRVLTAAEIGVPPSLMQTQTSAVKVEVKTAPKVAMPVPVPVHSANEHDKRSRWPVPARNSVPGPVPGSMPGSTKILALRCHSFVVAPCPAVASAFSVRHRIRDLAH